MLPHEALLERFWGGHNPFASSRSQYRAELYCADEAQREQAQAHADRLSADLGRSVVTPIQVGATFFPAEDYHQKWRLRRNKALFEALLENFDSESELLASTAAAKLNAYAGGHWAPESLERELEGLGVNLTRSHSLRSLGLG